MASSNNDNDDKKTLSDTEAYILDMLKKANLNKKTGEGGAAAPSEETKKRHLFWETQPMPHDREEQALVESGGNKKDSGDGSKEAVFHNGPVVPDKKLEDIRATPYNMPSGFEWCSVDITEEKDRLDVYTLLAENYVEDDDCMFRFDYSQEFLIWALTPPGFKKDFHVGVRSSKSGKLVALITAVPAEVNVYDKKKVGMVEINFLCVHKKLRSKRLAPVLIKEITRRVNLEGIFQAVYTAGVVLPVPVSSCRYYHRSLNPKKLVDIKFSRLHPRMTMARLIKLMKLPNEPSSKLVPMEPRHVSSAHKLLMEKHLNQFPLHVEFTEDDFAHWFLPRPGVINSYIVEEESKDGSPSNNVTDLVSFYHLPSSIIGNPKYSHLRAVYSFYNVATSVALTELMRDALILAQKEKVDVYNCLSQMKNSEFLDELRFGMGDGNLQYYLYNWSCSLMESKDVGIVLL